MDMKFYSEPSLNGLKRLTESLKHPMVVKSTSHSILRIFVFPASAPKPGKWEKKLKLLLIFGRIYLAKKAYNTSQTLFVHVRIILVTSAV